MVGWDLMFVMQLDANESGKGDVILEKTWKVKSVFCIGQV